MLEVEFNIYLIKKFGKFSIVINDLEWNSPKELGDRIESYLSLLNVLSERKNFNAKVLSEFIKGHNKVIILLTEWEE